MTRNTTDGMSSTRALLLGGLVVVAVVGAVFLTGGDDGKESVQDQPAAPQEEVLEVHPLVPQGSIKSASWHKGNPPVETLEPDEDETVSLIEASGLGEDDEEARGRKSLEKVVSEIHGLGVYVAPAGADEEKTKRK
jgi:hypothetical protein